MQPTGSRFSELPGWDGDLHHLLPKALPNTMSLIDDKVRPTELHRPSPGS